MRSELELRFAGVDRQSTDRTCGLAAMATALRILGIDTDEERLARLAGLPAGSPASVAALTRAAGAAGAAVYPARSTWARLTDYFGHFPEPVVALLRLPEPHFSVVLQAGPEAVYLADPSLGRLALGPQAFRERWRGIVLFVRRAHARGAPQGSATGPPGADGPLASLQARHRRLVRLQLAGEWAGSP